MIRPKKHLGQHFLIDQNIARKIVDALSLRFPVLEIGPGTGILTRILLEKTVPQLRLIEVDREATAYLVKEFPSVSDRLITADVLKTDLGGMFPSEFSIIGNFPYNISSQIFFKILENREKVKEVVCMIQKEVAQRMANPPGSKTYGILSVLVQTFYDIEYLFTVGEQVFNPPPNVKSAVIRLRRNRRESLPCPEELYFRVVKTAFNQRRKTLRNALKPLVPEADRLPADILSRRAEQLSVEEFIHLTSLIGEIM
ncbi:MAG: 16S rRNA (adenine(1518)-N(6)/adenine(1519)-N(6))-dimethyltransferase RsmA [Bacteroidetes bacterium]|nr:16S rRNA (adenine(1518)-N(6)/adenine(1519)-N(6))-dimethyltransferase RsmA [Bacteroidota bacterium]